MDDDKANKALDDIETRIELLTCKAMAKGKINARQWYKGCVVAGMLAANPEANAATAYEIQTALVETAADLADALIQEDVENG